MLGRAGWGGSSAGGDRVGHNKPVVISGPSSCHRPAQGTPVITRWPFMGEPCERNPLVVMVAAC